MRSLLTLLFWAACLAAVSSAAPLTDKSNGKAGDVAPLGVSPVGGHEISVAIT
jgi:hypothetical protein